MDFIVGVDPYVFDKSYMTTCKCILIQRTSKNDVRASVYSA